MNFFFIKNFQLKLLLSLIFLLSGCSAELKRNRINLNFSNACDSDRLKYCSTSLAGDGRVNDCVRENFLKLSEGCKKFIQDSNKVFDEAFFATMKTCEVDHERECSHVKKYAARRINCLKDVYLNHPEKISSICKTQFAKILDIIPPVQP
jgi:hypothetical protein